MTKTQRQPDSETLVKIGFLASCMLDCLDQLTETAIYKHKFKMELNRFIESLEQVTETQYNMYKDVGFIGSVTGTEGNTTKEHKVHGLDILFGLSARFENLVEFVGSAKASEIAYLGELINKAKNESEPEFLIEPVQLSEAELSK